MNIYTNTHYIHTLSLSLKNKILQNLSLCGLVMVHISDSVRSHLLPHHASDITVFIIKDYKLMALYIINIKIHLTVKKAQVL